MDRIELIRRLNAILLEEMPEYRPWARQFPRDTAGQRRLLRGLMNLRPPLPPGRELLELQDALLCAEREEKEIVEGSALPPAALHPRLALWQGDITCLRADAIVNAGNLSLTF